MSNAHRHAGCFLLTLAACVVSLPLAFAQGTDEQTAACTGDAFTLCRGDIPDVAKITACMRAHKAQLSSRCRAVFDAGDRKAAPEPKVATAPKAAPEPRKAPARTTIEARKRPDSRKAPVRQVTKAPLPRAAAQARAPRIAQETAARPRPPRANAERIERRPRPAAVVVVAPRPLAPAVEQPVAVPAAPAPERLPGLAAYRASIVSSCDRGLIDPYTCQSSLEALKTIE